MGGNAIKDARRIDYAELCIIETEIKTKLSQFDVDMDWEIPAAYRKKETFGDIDILITYKSDNWKDNILKIFRPSQHSSNGNCLSIDYDGVQVDFIYYETYSEFLTAYNYFSWNDLGNLLGRVAHKNGMKFGHDGLWLRVEYEGTYLGYVKVTDNMKSILKILGYDYKRWAIGFDTLEDIFQFVVSSQHFDPSSYEYEALDHQNRLRNRKRKVYQAFLEWLKDKTFPSPSPIYLGLHDTNVFTKRDALIENHKMQKYLKQFFNGNIVTEFTGLTGKELGEFMSEYKNQYQSFDVHVLSEIERHGSMEKTIMEFYNAKKDLRDRTECP